MNDRQRAKLNMYIVVRDFLQANQSVWNNIPKFVQAVSAFLAELTKLEGLSQAQAQPSTGVTADKAQLQRAMADAAMPIVGGLGALAAELMNNDLAHQADFSRSDFIHEPDLETADNADIVHNLATTHAAALADCGVTQAQIDALDASIIAFRAKIGAPRQVIVSTSTATTEIALTIAKIDTILNKTLDNLVEVIRPANTTFYTGYQSARVIIDPGSSSPPSPPPPSPPPPSPPPPSPPPPSPPPPP